MAGVITYDPNTVQRLAALHGRDRAFDIVAGVDAPTNADVAAWRALGQPAAPEEHSQPAAEIRQIAAQIVKLVDEHFPAKPLPTMREIAAKVAADKGLSLDDLRGPRRLRAIAHARFEAMRQMREVRLADGAHRFSTTQIGRFFGRDHSTVIQGIQALQRAAQA